MVEPLFLLRFGETFSDCLHILYDLWRYEALSMGGFCVLKTFLCLLVANSHPVRHIS